MSFISRECRFHDQANYDYRMTKGKAHKLMNEAKNDSTMPIFGGIVSVALSNHNVDLPEDN